MKKSLNIFYIVTVFMFVFMGCGSTTPESSSSSPSPIPIEGEGEIGNFHIVIKSAESGKDYSDADYIIVTYEWTNNSDKTTSFMIPISAKAFQDGIECSSAIMAEGVESNDQLKEIQSGTTMELKIAYVLNNKESPVDIEVTENFSFDIEKVTKSFVLPL